MNCGVYSITHLESGKRYIGSSVNIKRRMAFHKSRLRANAHENQYLQNVWNKDGENSFAFEKLIVCAPNDNIFYEQKVMDGYQSYRRDLGFNLKPKAENCEGMTAWNKGKNLSETHKKNLSIARKGIRVGPYKSGNAIKTHCSKGHKYSVENTYVNQGRRACRACRHAREKLRLSAAA